ncbi:MAG: Maf family protein [Gammaproteobacteria bacterium]|nr:Maf family protein [Gammaproteobacteria bacterium]
MLVLASASPRRRALLARLGLDFETRAAGVCERRLPGEPPGELSARLALAKAQHVFEQFGGARRVLAGDTVVALGGEVFGKPAGRDEAVAMLKTLSGKSHTVFTAVALLAPRGRRARRLSETEVVFRKLAPRQIEEYCDGGEPLDKAGGYAIQGGGANFVRHLRGSYSGVVGLPLWDVWRLLREDGCEC